MNSYIQRIVDEPIAAEKIRGGCPELLDILHACQERRLTLMSSKVPTPGYYILKDEQEVLDFYSSGTLKEWAQIKGDD